MHKLALAIAVGDTCKGCIPAWSNTLLPPSQHTNTDFEIKKKKISDIYCKNECPRDRKNLQGLGFVKIDLIASSTLVIVRAGLQLSFKISIIKLPAVSTLQW